MTKTAYPPRVGGEQVLRIGPSETRFLWKFFTISLSIQPEILTYKWAHPFSGYYTQGAPSKSALKCLVSCQDTRIGKFIKSMVIITIGSKMNFIERTKLSQSLRIERLSSFNESLPRTVFSLHVPYFCLQLVDSKSPLILWLQITDRGSLMKQQGHLFYKPRCKIYKPRSRW